MSINNVFFNASNENHIENHKAILPNDFELSPEGEMAIKYCTIKNDEGVEKRYVFKVYLTQKNIDSNFEHLKSFTDAKVNAIIRHSMDLGLGFTHSSVNFSGGRNSKLSLKRRDGKEEVIDEKTINATELKLSKETNKEKKIILIKTIRAFRTIDHAVKNTTTGKFLKSIQQRLLLMNGVREIRDDHKNDYINNVLVSIYYNNIYENLKNASLEELNLFCKSSENFQR